MKAPGMLEERVVRQRTSRFSHVFAGGSYSVGYSATCGAADSQAFRGKDAGIDALM